MIKLQKRVARIILDTDYFAPSAPLFKQLQWMTIENRITFHKCVLVFKCIKGQAPIYLSNKIKHISENNPYQLRNAIKGDLHIPKTRTELFKKSFSYSAPTLWNSLPIEVRNEKTIPTFKDQLKLLLMSLQEDE